MSCEQRPVSHWIQKARDCSRHELWTACLELAEAATPEAKRELEKMINLDVRRYERSWKTLGFTRRVYYDQDAKQFAEKAVGRMIDIIY